MGRHHIELYIIEVFIYIYLEISDGEHPFLVSWPNGVGMYVCAKALMWKPRTTFRSQTAFPPCLWGRVSCLYGCFYQDSWPKSFQAILFPMAVLGSQILTVASSFSMGLGQTQVIRCVQQVLLPAVLYPQFLNLHTFFGDIYSSLFNLVVYLVWRLNPISHISYVRDKLSLHPQALTLIFFNIYFYVFVSLCL